MSFLIYYILIIIALILVSAFFSGSETGMMSLNRYRLRHMARKGNRRAIRVEHLLKRPDRLLGTILIGNTFANVLASAVVTIVVGHYFSEFWVLMATILLTILILIFSETAPKTLAALYPERVALPASIVLRFLLFCFYPLVWLINGIANFVLRCFRIQVIRREIDSLSMEELRTVVNASTGKISSSYQKMLLRIMELEKITVEDVMVPRNEIVGIDLDGDWEGIIAQLYACEHAHIPLYHDNIDNVIGMLSMRKVFSYMQQQKLTRETLRAITEKVYFVPDTALLNRQLLQFQEQQKKVALVVDEYRDIQGLVTLQDVVEEVVGEFAQDVGEVHRQLKKQKDGSVVVDGSINVRDLNRLTDWNLPVDGPRTLSGLMIEYLEMIPTSGVACRIAGYPMEVLEVLENTIQTVQVWPELRVESDNPSLEK